MSVPSPEHSVDRLRVLYEQGSEDSRRKLYHSAILDIANLNGLMSHRVARAFFTGIAIATVAFVSVASVVGIFVSTTSK